MAYDEALAERIRNVLTSRDGIREKKMFGGLTFLLNGNMICGVVNEDLVVRVGPARYEELLAKPHARLMDFTGRSIKGMVYVGPGGYEADDSLIDWVGHGVAFASTLPAK